MKNFIMAFLLSVVFLAAGAMANDHVTLTIPASKYPIDGRLLVTYSGSIGEQIVPSQLTKAINIKPSGHSNSYQIILPTCSSAHRACADITSTTVELRHKGKLYYSCNYHASLSAITAPAPKVGNPTSPYDCDVVT